MTIFINKSSFRTIIQIDLPLSSLLSVNTDSVLKNIRLKRAAEMLRAKSDNVTQIAYSVGFSRLSYFNKCFKGQLGITSRQFAKQNIQF